MKNRVNLIGHLGAAPEVKSTEDGKKWCNFSVATNRSWKNDKGDKVEQTTWHSIKAWDKKAELVGQYVKKGDLVDIEGMLMNEKYDKDGETRYHSYILLDGITFLSKKE